MSSIGNIFANPVMGLTLASNQMANTSQKIAAYGTGTAGSDDLSQNLVDLSTEKLAFQANAAVLKTVNQTLGTLLDVFDTPKKS